MSTLPRPTGKELIRALERAGFITERIRGSHYFLRRPDGALLSFLFVPIKEIRVLAS